MLSALTAGAQYIEQGSMWYNGALVYTATLHEGGKVLLGSTVEGEELEFMLVPVKGEPGTYIIDINTKEAIQLPTNEGLVAIDPEKREVHMSNYLYHPDGGRYSVERVYTIDGRFTGKEYRIAD